ncbi:MAG: TRAP transporter small permease [Spirochaetales bacterium]
MRKLNDFIEKLFLTLGVGLLTVFIVAVFLQVVARNYLHLPLMWTDEVAVISFVWSVFLGAAVAVRRKRHYTVELFPSRLVRTNALLNVLADGACFFLMYVMVVYGWTFTQMGLSRFSTALGIAKAYFFFAIPVSGTAMVLFGFEVFVKDMGQLIHLLKGKKV